MLMSHNTRSGIDLMMAERPSWALKATLTSKPRSASSSAIKPAISRSSIHRIFLASAIVARSAGLDGLAARLRRQFAIIPQK
jgi:hypothetical protein